MQTNLNTAAIILLGFAAIGNMANDYLTGVSIGNQSKAIQHINETNREQILVNAHHWESIEYIHKELQDVEASVHHPSP